MIPDRLRVDVHRVCLIVLQCALILGGVCLPGPVSAASVDYYETTTNTLCYTCTFVQSIHQEQDLLQGRPGCADPFHGSTIPRIECNGACGKVYRKTEDGHLLSRGCLPKCQPATHTDGSYIDCCYSDLCNDSTPTLSLRSRCLHLVLALITSLLAVAVAGRAFLVTS